MARDHGRILVDIWSNDDFTSLVSDSQLVYFMLLSSADLSWCGVAPNVPERYAGLAKGLTARRVRQAIANLVAEGFLVLDEQTGEILVRSFVRHDGILKQPNVAKAMVRALFRTRSPRIKSRVIDELARARRGEPDAKGWKGIEDENPNLFGVICEKAKQNGWANPSGKGSENG